MTYSPVPQQLFPPLPAEPAGPSTFRSLVTTASRLLWMGAAGGCHVGFQNAGYRGMYNVDLGRLRAMKGLAPGDGTLLDFMGKRELAANLFRLTETDAKLKADRVKGQAPAEGVAYAVGRKVRNMMIDTDGTRPELLPVEGNVKDVRKGLKQTAKALKQLDGPPKKARKKK